MGIVPAQKAGRNIKPYGEDDIATKDYWHNRNFLAHKHHLKTPESNLDFGIEF
jgi:hypothetical protein